MSKTLTKEIKFCEECPFHETVPDPDPDDWFNDDDVKVVCEKVGKDIDVSLRPYQVENIEIPSWCPLQEKER